MSYSIPYPEIIQIEISTFCNFNCSMCTRQNWKDKPAHFDITLFKKLAQSTFPNVKKIVLYGVGEPLMHPEFVKILQITREFLPKDGKIDFTTNGSLISPEILEKILLNDINRIVVSLDTINMIKLETIREGVSEDIFENIKQLGIARKEGKFQEFAIETVAMRSNLHDLPYLMDYLPTVHADRIFVTNLLPHSEEMKLETLYSTVTQYSWDVSKEILESSWDHLSSLIVNPVYTKGNKGGIQKLIKRAQKQIKTAQDQGRSINFPLVLENFKKVSVFNKAKEIFQQIEEKGKLYNIKVDLPEIIPKLLERKCPYIDQKAVVIDVHGNIAPCYNLLHKHNLYINQHNREEREFYFGNLKKRTLTDIWKTMPYAQFRKRLENFPENIPWCGDCTYSTHNCFFVKSNEYDCYGNTPGCNECLYSAGIVKCIF